MSDNLSTSVADRIAAIEAQNNTSPATAPMDVAAEADETQLSAAPEATQWGFEQLTQLATPINTNTAAQNQVVVDTPMVDQPGTAPVDEVPNNAHAAQPPIFDGGNTVQDGEDQTGEDEQNDNDANNHNNDGQNADGGDGNAPNVPNTDHFVYVNRGDAVDESSSCRICMTDPDPLDALYTECGHVWCKGCLNQYFIQVFTDRDAFPPRCCQQAGFSLDNVQTYLEDEVLIHVMDKWEEWSAEDPTYCSNIQCRAFVPADRVQGQWAVCLLCEVKTCVECKAKNARHTSPSQHPEPTKDQENADLAKKEGWKYCPNSKCNKLVEKIDGCDTMTCKCGQQFCYRCGNGYDTPYPCTCNGQNAWVGDMQAWAAGADGQNRNDGGETEEDDEDEEDDSDFDDEEEDNDEDDIDSNEENDDAEGTDGDGEVVEGDVNINIHI